MPKRRNILLVAALVVVTLCLFLVWGVFVAIAAVFAAVAYVIAQPGRASTWAAAQVEAGMDRCAARRTGVPLPDYLRRKAEKAATAAASEAASAAAALAAVEAATAAATAAAAKAAPPSARALELTPVA